MKRPLIIIIVCMFTTGCSVTAKPTPTLIPTPTLTPTLIPTSTPTPTPTPSFPASYEDFEKEVRENCVIPPQEAVNEIENSALNRSEYQKIYQDYQTKYNVAPDDAKKALKWNMMFREMMFWLADQATEEENFVTGADPYSTNITPDNWYCVGVILFPPAPIGKSPNEYFEELVPLLNEDWWGKWEYPITFSYWSKDGLVVYKYEPATMPAP